MTWLPFQIIGGAYSDDTKPWTCQDTVNYIPVMAEKEGTRSPSILRDAPGLQLFAKTSPKAAIRGMHNAEGFLVVVAGTHLCSVSTKGVVTKLGDIPGRARVAITHNQVTGGVQIVVANGPSGYVYDTAKSTFTQITDPGFPGAISTGYMDSYIIGVEPLGRYWMTSDLADATSWNTLNEYEAESAPDKIVGLIVSHQEVVVFGERTIEFFEDTGTDTITFQTKQGLQAQIGAASRYAIAALDNGIVWLGNDGSFYILNGYTPTRKSTHAIEAAIAGLDWSKCFATVFNSNGHKIAYFTFPDGQTWGYDASNDEWHRRKSYGMDRWRLNDLVYWNGEWIGGDFDNGNLYKLDWEVSDENGEPMERMRTSGVTSATGNKLRVDALALEFDTGRKSKAGALAFDFTISGNVSDGVVGGAGSGAYTSANGAQPITYAVTAGAFPAGLTLAVDGSWSGSYTTADTYSWTVTATDALGNTAVLTDSAIIVALASVTGAVAHWKLNDSGDTAADSSGNGLDLAYTGTITKQSETITPNGAAAALFGGGCAYADNATLATLPVEGNGFSVAAWIKHDALGYPPGVMSRIAGCTVAADFTGNGNFVLGLARYDNDPPGDPLFFFEAHDSGTADGGVASPNGEATLMVGTLSADHLTLKLYQGTELLATSTRDTAAAAGASYMRIGGSEVYPDSYGCRFVISDVILFNKELTQDDIITLFANGAYVTYESFP